MARILALESDTPPALRDKILESLRPCDECVILPSAEISDETGRFRNMVFTLDGEAPHAPTGVMSDDWYVGVSGVKLGPEDRDHILRVLDSGEKRHDIACRLRDGIVSENAESKVTVGPRLECDEHDRDVGAQWTAGFDHSSCCVGVYTCEHPRVAEVGQVGTRRCHTDVYLVCKAGGGQASSSFHSKLVASLKRGRTLQQALEGGSEPGPQALRRVASAGSRNRSAILAQAAEILGCSHVDTIGDQSSGGSIRGASVAFDVCANVLTREEHITASGERTKYVYTTCVSSRASNGLCSVSNVADGFLLFADPVTAKCSELRVDNDASNCIPFTTKRVSRSINLAECETARICKGERLVDEEFIRRTFVWKNRRIDGPCDQVTPFSLLGSHDSEGWLNEFGRELGVGAMTSLWLRPALVCVAGENASRVRGICRSVTLAGRNEQPEEQQ